MKTAIDREYILKKIEDARKQAQEQEAEQRAEKLYTLLNPFGTSKKR